MPLYEFRCQSCGKTFEKLIRGPDKSVGVQCPECDCKEVTKVFSAFATSGSSDPPSADCPSGSFT